MQKTLYRKRKIRSKLRRTQKRGIPKSYRKSHIIQTFLQMLNVIKVYHWKTRSYAEHKATDELYERLN